MRRTFFVVLLALATMSGFALVSATHAVAAPLNHTSAITLDGTSAEQQLVGEHHFCDECAPDALFSCGGCQVAAGATVEVHRFVAWTAPVSIDSTYDPDELHQGQTAGVQDSLSPGAGPIQIRYRIDYAVGIFACDGIFDPCGPDPKNWQVTGNLTLHGQKTLQAGTDCTPPLSGSVVCVASDSVELLPETCFFDLCPVDITVELVINHTFTINAGDVSVHRTATSVPDTDLTFGGPVPSVVDDEVTIPCTATPGTAVNYDLGPASYSPANVKVTGSAGLHVIIDGPGPLDADPTIPLGHFSEFNGPMTMSGAAAPEFSLGTVLLDNVAPDVSAIVQGGTFVEGSQTQFDAVATDNCSATLTYRWEYSDGGVSFSSPTHHVFHDNGLWTGTVAVRDAAGNATSEDFSVNGSTGITNGDPSVPTPPNKASVWGVPLTFHADAVDPGSDDQPTLSIQWNFDDGAGALGADVVHAYANPGTFTVEIRVTDKDGGVGTASLTAAIGKRHTSTTYTGATQALPNKSMTLSGQVTDEVGDPVVGLPLQFNLGAQGASALTNASGIASKALKLNQHKGAYTVTATFAATSRYLGSADSADFTIGN